MKRLSYALTISLSVIISTIQAEQETKQEPFKIILEAQWKDLESDHHKTNLFDGKWILAGSITFKKRSSDAVFLDTIQLTWKGKPIENLVGSLYENNSDAAFLPIEKYLICDCQWKASTQQLLMKFDQPLTLGAVNRFYLVLTVPESLEPVLKKGSFQIERTGLPLAFREYVKDKHLAIALENTHTNSNRT